MLRKLFRKSYYIRLRFKKGSEDAFLYKVSGNFPLPAHLKEILATELDKYLHYGEN